MAAPATVDEYIAGFPPARADRLQRIRGIIVAAVRDATGREPEERIRYGIAAVMLGGRYALHYAGWKKHIGLYPVPPQQAPLEQDVAPHRAEKDSVTFSHTQPLPDDLVRRIAEAVVAERGALPA